MESDMLTMIYNIEIEGRRLAVLDSVEIHDSVELLANTATIKLPASVYNKPLKADELITRGSKVKIELGYKEVETPSDVFEGFVKSVSTDGGTLTVVCEDSLYLFRKEIPNKVLLKASLKAVVNYVLYNLSMNNIKLDCSLSWTYAKFAIQNATGYDVLKKIQDEVGADVYIKDGTLYIHARAEHQGNNHVMSFQQNIEKSDLTYEKAEDHKIKIVVKATDKNGTIKTIEVGSSEGDKKEIRCASSDTASMKIRGENELKRLSYDGYKGSVTGWLYPAVNAGDTVQLYDADYSYKDGKYFVNSVTTTFGSSGGARKIEVGFRVS